MFDTSLHVVFWIAKVNWDSLICTKNSMMFNKVFEYFHSYFSHFGHSMYKGVDA